MKVQNVSDPVYAPNSKGDPRADGKRYPETAIWEASGEFMRAAYTRRRCRHRRGEASPFLRCGPHQGRDSGLHGAGQSGPGSDVGSELGVVGQTSRVSNRTTCCTKSLAVRHVDHAGLF